MKYLLLTFLFLSSVAITHAQADSTEFSVRFFAGTDTTAPTTPVLVSVDPVSPNQIDLSWTTSTDNFSLGGYVVSRGSSTLATTTLTTFSDTSVSASTTYTYSVQAFDSTLNYSSSSNSISSTTPDFPVIPPEVEQDGTTQGTVARIVTREVTVMPGTSTTSLVVETARPVRLTVRWGRSDDYELGYSVSEFFSINHSLLLSDLEPGTKYDYEIIAETPFGLQTVVQAGQFTTLQNSVSDIPQNVLRFLAIPSESDVKLSWELPPASDIAFVRVVRSHLGFPSYPNNGAVVYQGLATNFLDRDILDSYSPVYYTVFVYTQDGKVSSGAIAIAYRESEVNQADGVSPPSIRFPQTPEKITEATSSIVQDRVTPEMKLPELSEVIITQGGNKYSFINPEITLSAVDSFTVRVPVESVAGNLKSIIGTLLDPTDNQKNYSFLLRVNEDKSYYEAVIPPLSVTGDSVLEVAVYDYEVMIVATYTSPIRFEEQRNELTPVLFPDVFFYPPVSVLLGGTLIGALLLVLLLVFRHRHEDKA